MGVLDVLASASPNRRTVHMCIDGALQAQWDDLSDQLDAAAQADAQETGSLALPNVTRLVNELEDIRERVEASQVTFVFEKMDWVKRYELQASNPPRKGNLHDRFKNVNTSAFYPQLIRESVVSITDRDGDTVLRADIPEDVWVSLLGRPAGPPSPEQPAGDPPAVSGSLNMGQIDRLIGAAEQVNDGATVVPPSARSLLGSQDSGASLAQPSPGTSARNGSAGGSRRTSPRSSTTAKKTASSKARSAAT